MGLFGVEITTIVNGFGECCSLLRGMLVSAGVVRVWHGAGSMSYYLELEHLVCGNCLGGSGHSGKYHKS